MRTSLIADLDAIYKTAVAHLPPRPTASEFRDAANRILPGVLKRLGRASGELYCHIHELGGHESSTSGAMCQSRRSALIADVAAQYVRNKDLLERSIICNRIIDDLKRTYRNRASAPRPVEIDISELSRAG